MSNLLQTGLDLGLDLYSKAKDKVQAYRGTEVEKKVLEATSLENWGASSSLKEEIARATYDYEGYSQVMSLLWTRMAESGKNWKACFKSLELLDYLIRHGSDRVIGEARDRIYTIRSLRDFQYVDPNDGKDKGAGIREKSKQVVDLLGNQSLIDEERSKADKLRNKYRGYEGGGGSGFGGRSSGGFGNSGYGNSSGYDYEREREREREKRENEVNAAASTENEEPKKKTKKKGKKKVAKKSSAEVEAPEPEPEVEEPEPEPEPVKKKKSSKKTASSKAVPTLDKPPKDKSSKTKKPEPTETVDDEEENEDNEDVGDVDEAFAAFHEAPAPVAAPKKNVSTADDFLLSSLSGVAKPSSPGSPEIFGDFASAPAPKKVQPVFNSGVDDLLFGSPQAAPQPTAEPDLFGGFVSAPTAQENFSTVKTLSGKTVQVKGAKPTSAATPASEKPKPKSSSDPWDMVNLDLSNASGAVPKVNLEPSSKQTLNSIAPSLGYTQPAAPAPGPYGYGAPPAAYAGYGYGAPAPYGAQPAPQAYGGYGQYPPPAAYGAYGAPANAARPAANAAPKDPFASFGFN